jgi:hypothetical protein
MILIIKMVVNCGFTKVAKANLLNLCNIDTILGLLCVLPILEFGNALINFVYGKNVFVCDCIATIKMCKVDLYGDSNTSFASYKLFKVCRCCCKDIM